VRAVIDTNVLLSGLLWRGAPHALIEHVQAGALAMISSPALLAELADVISRAKFDAILARSNTSRERSLDEMRQMQRCSQQNGLKDLNRVRKPEKEFARNKCINANTFHRMLAKVEEYSENDREHEATR